PGFLVASPSLACPFFNHSLVLMIEHGDEGSFGFVVNKAAGIGLESVAEELSIMPSSNGETMPVMLGGPVSPNSGWILFDPTGRALPRDEDRIQIDAKIALTASAEVLRRFIGGE